MEDAIALTGLERGGVKGGGEGKGEEGEGRGRGEQEGEGRERKKEAYLTIPLRDAGQGAGSAEQY